MALPTTDDIKTMDYGFEGQPFVNVPAKDIDLTTMDYAFEGQPFVSNPFAGEPPAPSAWKPKIMWWS